MAIVEVKPVEQTCRDAFLLRFPWLQLFAARGLPDSQEQSCVTCLQWTTSLPSPCQFASSSFSKFRFAHAGLSVCAVGQAVVAVTLLPTGPSSGHTGRAGEQLVPSPPLLATPFQKRLLHAAFFRLKRCLITTFRAQQLVGPG